MNTNSSKRHQVVSSGNKFNANNSTIDEVHQISCNAENETSKGDDFLIFCQDSALKFFQDKTLHTLNCSTDPGN